MALFIEPVQWSPSPSSGRYLHRATRSTWNSAKLLTLFLSARKGETQRNSSLPFTVHLPSKNSCGCTHFGYVITVRYFSDSHILVRIRALGQNHSSSFDPVKQLIFRKIYLCPVFDKASLAGSCLQLINLHPVSHVLKHFSIMPGCCINIPQ